MNWLPACLDQLELCPRSCSSAEVGWQCRHRIDGFARTRLIHLAAQHGSAAPLILARPPRLCLGGLRLEPHRVLYRRPHYISASLAHHTLQLLLGHLLGEIAGTLRNLAGNTPVGRL